MNDLEHKLKQRELLRLNGKDSNGNDFEVRYYDTGQFWIKGKKKSEKRYMEGNRHICEEVFEDCYITYSNSGGLSSHLPEAVSGVGGGSGVYANEMYSGALSLLRKKGINVDYHTGKFQEQTVEENVIDEFVSDLHNCFASTKWEKHEHPLEYLPVVLAGHGNIHPLAVFHPVIAAQIAKDFVFPFHQETGFSLSKGRKKLEEQDLIEENPGEYVCLVRRGHYERKKDFVQVIDVFFFNKKNYQDYKMGEFKVKSEIPSVDDTVFGVTYIWEHGEKHVHVSANKFNRPYLEHEKLLENKPGDIYLKIEDLKKDEERNLIPRNFWVLNEQFFKTLERRADLPLYLLR